MSEFPRALLLTSAAPDARYRMIRRTADQIPPDRLWWCSLQQSRPESTFAFTHQSFVARQLHWRLGGTSVDYLYAKEWQARSLAKKIVEWVRSFKPEILWVLAEMGTVSIAFHLRRMLDVPVHATVYDAHQTAKWHVPYLYYPIYMRSADRFFREISSFDSISSEMTAYLMRRYPRLQTMDNVVFLPVVVGKYVADRPASPWEGAGHRKKRIGFCGTNRVSPWQWQDFLNLLGQLPYEFEIIAFTNRDSMSDAVVSSNTSIVFEPFSEREEDVVHKFRALRIHACYLGLWKEQNRTLFAQTSLSSKLATYSAAGCPVIVDGSAKSVAWRLISQYGAGVLCGASRDEAKSELTRLLDDVGAWTRMSEGATRMCKKEFDLEQNIGPFRDLLTRTGGQVSVQ